ncbi:MAG: FadR/GntR family transcriptional regulator [Planctomycetota bacterium]
MTETATLETVRRETLVDGVAQALIQFIAAKRLKPGDRLPTQRELAEMMGVSQLALREALGMLKALGIIEPRHGSGIFVRQMDISTIFGMLSPLLRTVADVSVEQIGKARFHLEPLVAELAAANRTEQNLEVLGDSLEGMQASTFEMLTYIGHDAAFHQELARSTGNSIFHVVMASITDLVREVRLLHPDNRKLYEFAVEEHQRVLEAVRDRNGPSAAVAMREHIRAGAERMGVIIT